MLKIENAEVYGFEAAIRGMRNPMNSWDRSDSDCKTIIRYNGKYVEDFIGDNDLKLMKQLAKAGSVHAKYRRMITVTCDITAPLYFYKEWDTYKVGTVRNSCSTMHKISEKEFMLEDFSCEHLIDTCLLESVINELNIYRGIYNDYDKQTDNYKKEFSKKDIWWQMIQLLPSSYNQKRTVMLNYEVLANIYKSRKNHKLDEWLEFCKWIERLPFHELIDETNSCDEG